MISYKNFFKLDLDISCLGLYDSDPPSTYFCTPKGAKIFGREGVDGIHYCFIAGFEDMVFAVHPMGLPGEYVYPIAVCFEDLLRLLLACGSMAAIEQVFGWSKEHFDKYMSEYPPTDEQKKVLNEIGSIFELEPMKDPFEYIKEVQKDFDYSKIKFTKEYYDTVPDAVMPKDEKFEVYFNGFGSGGKGQRPGTETLIDKEFTWGNDIIYIPAVYSFTSGLVVDLCIRVPADIITEYVDKALYYGEDMPDDIRDELESSNPFNFHADYNIVLNGKVLHWSNASSEIWNPAMPDGFSNSRTAFQLMEHYNLDEDSGWTFVRVSFPSDSKRKAPVKSLAIEFKPQPEQVSGGKFITKNGNETFDFVHPSTNQTHTLNVLELADDQLCGKHFSDSTHEYPLHLKTLKYNISPALPNGSYFIRDTAHSDQPKAHYDTSAESAAIGIIGGADGPTAFFIATGDKSNEYKTAASSLHFEPVDSVEWQIVFNVVTKEEMIIKLK